MSSSAPQIGFDRFIQLEWVAAVLGERACSNRGGLDKLLDAACLGQEARVKTQTKLNAFGLRPREDLAAFVERGSSTVRDHQCREGVLPFAWGVAIATYPFFGKVAELTGRLTSLQGDCSVSEIHRRMSEAYGDRAVTKRAAQAVMQTQAEWGVLKRVERGKRIVRLPQSEIDNDLALAWLVEAAVRYAERPVSVPRLQSLPVLFPFNLTRPVAYVVSKYPNLSLRSDGPSNQFVTLRDAT